MAARLIGEARVDQVPAHGSATAVPIGHHMLAGHTVGTPSVVGHTKPSGHGLRVDDFWNSPISVEHARVALR